MKPADWNEHLEPQRPWRHAYWIVEVEVRNVLSQDRFAHDLLSTTALVELLYPVQFAVGGGRAARNRIFKALAALATRGLAEYTTRGEPVKIKRLGKLARPWLWHAPRAQAAEEPNCCPHCGEEL